MSQSVQQLEEEVERCACPLARGHTSASVSQLAPGHACRRGSAITRRTRRARQEPVRLHGHWLDEARALACGSGRQPRSCRPRCATTFPLADLAHLPTANARSLHGLLENKGVNSRKVKDIHGREFPYPVNDEHKATVFFPILFTCKQPHMYTFWAATAGFFCTFFSCFAPSAIGSKIKKAPPEGLGLGKFELSTAGNCAVTGTILMRVLAGPLCDKFGARKTFVMLLLVGVPGMALMMVAQSYPVYLTARMLIGLSLATFVTCQVWCSQFFDRKIVGTVNATAGGWGNVGGGFTLLLMPQIFAALESATGSNNTAWRMCFILPIVMHVVASLFILFGRDLADGSYAALEKMGAKQKSKGGGNVAILGFSNTNAWILLVTYGLCFGVELTMNNKLTGYFERYHAMPNTLAGPLGATFSLMNLFARSWGGILSDWLAKRYGIRGRIWGMWTCQTLEGFMCILFGLCTTGYDSPDEIKFHNTPLVNSTWTSGYGTQYTFPQPSAFVSMCESDTISAPSHGFVNGLWTAMPVGANYKITVKDPNPDCIHNNPSSMVYAMICIVVFSMFVQMSEGLHFGVVPYVSRPALGVVSGMVGAGGNTGALISGQFIVKAGVTFPIDEGFIYLGIVIISVSMIQHLLYFPKEGGMLLPPGLPFDPQLIKPAADQKGADELDFKGKTGVLSGASTPDVSRSSV